MTEAKISFTANNPKFSCTETISNLSAKSSLRYNPNGIGTQKLIMTIGLPGSGKSLYAQEEVKKAGYYIIVHECAARTSGIMQESINWICNSERDIIRFKEFGKYKISKSQEKKVTEIQINEIKAALTRNQSVIISDTNLNPSTQAIFKLLAKEHNVEFEIKDFTHIPLETCITNDLKRSKSVGRDVILGFHQKYIRPNLYKHDFSKSDKPKAIVFDIDGTLSIINNRGAFDWDKVDQDLPNSEVINVLKMYKNNNYKILFCSGRMDCCKEKTVEWLKNNIDIELINFDCNPDIEPSAYESMLSSFQTEYISNHLFMRKTNDMRPDYEVKRELFLNYIDSEYNVKAVYDDRNSVCNIWRDLGLQVFQVADGNF